MKTDIVKEQYIEEVAKKKWRNDPGMIEYYRKKKEVVIRLSNGLFFAIDKPSIKKDFCFDDSYDFNGAQKLAEHARTSESYFIKENVERFDETIEKVLNNEYGYSEKAVKDYPEVKLVYDNYYNHEELTRFEECDREAIAEAYRKVKASLEKRVMAYLKRYGMSKVHSWTFWGEA